jgi:hypothetical protein
MSRQLEQALEQRETKRRDALVRALEYGLEGALEAQGITLIGFALKFDAYECLMTIKADVGGVRKVAFVGAGSPIDCILKAEQGASATRLRWKKDIYPG